MQYSKTEVQFSKDAGTGEVSAEGVKMLKD